MEMHCGWLDVPTSILCSGCDSQSPERRLINRRSTQISMTESDMFIEGVHYTREQIHEELGGNIQSYLPHVGGKVVCACLTLDSNPEAPHVILVGTGKDTVKYGQVLAQQSDAIPVFVKDSSNAWEYLGDYQVERSTTDPDIIETKAREAGRRGKVNRVIYLRSAAERSGSLYPNEVDNPDEPSDTNEGQVKEVLVDRRERDPALREACIEHFGAQCQVCDLDFGKRYGEDIGDGFIHVHHLRPLAEGERETDPVEDLRPVCPNCHAMLHQVSPPLSIQDLRQRLGNLENSVN